MYVGNLYIYMNDIYTYVDDIYIDVDDIYIYVDGIYIYVDGKYKTKILILKLNFISIFIFVTRTGSSMLLKNVSQNKSLASRMGTYLYHINTYIYMHAY